MPAFAVQNGLFWRRLTARASMSGDLNLDQPTEPHAVVREEDEPVRPRTAAADASPLRISQPVAPTEPHRVRDTAGSQILTAYEAVRAYEPVLRWADVETLHELRIAGKWLRYTLEFSKEALPPDASTLIARVTALQDHLGLLNDANVTAGMARSFLVENAGGLSTLEGAAIGRYLVSREKEVARLRRTVGGPWRGVAGVSFRRALGRTVAGL